MTKFKKIPVLAGHCNYKDYVNKQHQKKKNVDRPYSLWDYYLKIPSEQPDSAV